MESMLSELSKEEYLATMSGRMIDVTCSADPVIDIWPIVQDLVDMKLVPELVVQENLVEVVYRDQSGSYEHVLLPSDTKDRFVCLILDIQAQIAKGYYILDLRKEYGM